MRIETLCWVIHLLRVFFAQLFPLLNADQASKVEATNNERLSAATECAQLLLTLRPSVEQSVQSLQVSPNSRAAQYL